uniref:Ring finger protein 166 n=1 Tax=Gasterosteus aculeatus TaxID=69293 RepID=G3NDD4_GASAC
FCAECLQPCLQVTSPLCPLCRVPFDPKKVERSSSVEKQLASVTRRHMMLSLCYCVCSQVALAKMRPRIASCSKVQEQIANCPKFVPVVVFSVPNRSTFVCPFCGAGQLDQQALVELCMDSHRNDPSKSLVCPTARMRPSAPSNFLQHLLHRHKFSYDTFVDYSIDEEAALQAALSLSLAEN